MPLTLTWEQIALRILLAAIASLLIGLNRDEKGHPAGMRTTMPLTGLECTIRWRERPSHQPHTPDAIEQLRSLTWSE